MIEFAISKDGTRYFTWQGQHLCSSYKPKEEAKKWVQKYSERLVGVRSVIVLGLANGFHAAELVKSYPGISVCVINDNEHFVAPSSTILDLQASLFEVVTTNRPLDLAHLSRLKRYLVGSFAILEFAPAVATNPIFFKTVKELLLGRTAEALKFCLSCRSDEWNRISLNEVREVPRPEGVQLISFTDIKRSGSLDNLSNRSQRLVHILGELIK